MTIRPGAMNGFCWMDLKTRDTTGTARFFSGVLGWRFAVDEEDWRKAVKISVDGYPIGGVSDLANPVYPPETPAHIAYYLAVEDVDRRIEAATANGARLVLPPFDAGDQGRVAVLIDPVGASIALWQPYDFAGWEFPPGMAGTPHRMVLACAEPARARRFYRGTLGVPPDHADFVPASDPGGSAPRWELSVGVDDADGVVARAHDHGRAPVVREDEAGRRVVWLSSPEGLTLRVHGPG
ncbi:VOC family protein [Streptomyces sp. ST2-7A]|uniref:VOC family protein n=1 Tax=Streptomyces sp. ST2-7A TaxID=2907214 RepID=UPI001F1EE5C3|nr:VOC family protein [Streptomyces sp. ST2-7A]MCE7083014.1 VOC family protein [Streptomyces sp. ST2-7A]